MKNSIEKCLATFLIQRDMPKDITPPPKWQKN